jgi:hypothetical protein
LCRRSGKPEIAFALGFGGFLIAVAGVLSSKFLAVPGLLILLVILYSFWTRSAEQ